MSGFTLEVAPAVEAESFLHPTLLRSVGPPALQDAPAFQDYSRTPWSGHSTIEALVVEDHPLYQSALLDLIDRALGRLRSALAVASAEEALRIADRLKSLRVVLLDLGLPGLSGLDAMYQFKDLVPSVSVIIVSGSEDRYRINATLRAGAFAYVPKSSSPQLLVDVVKAAVARHYHEGVQEVPVCKVGAKEARPLLTRRQQQIFGLLAHGYTNKEIGRRLCLAEITVKQHVSALLRELGVNNRTQAVIAGRRLGLCSA